MLPLSALRARGRVFLLPAAWLLAACAGPGRAGLPDQSQLLQAHAGPVVAIALAAEEGLVASLGQGGDLRLWSLVEWGKRLAPGPILAAERDENLQAMALSPDGALVAGAGRTIHLWRTSDGQPLERRFPARLAWLRCLAFSPTGRHLAAGSDAGEVFLFETGGRLVSRRQVHRLPVLAVAISPDGSLLASGGADGKVALARTDGGMPPWRERLPADPIAALAFSADGQRVAASHGQDITEWHAASGERADLRQARSRVYALVYASYSSALHAATGSGVLRFWGRHEKAVMGWGTDDRAYSLALSPDHRTMVAGLADGSIAVWRW